MRASSPHHGQSGDAARHAGVSRPVLIALAVGSVGLLWLMLHVGLGPIAQAAEQLGWRGFGIVVLFHLGLIAAMGCA